MNKKLKLEQINNRIQELKQIISKSFKTDEELDNYIIEYQNEFDEYYSLRKEKEALEWELKTPDEKKQHEELIKKMKLKRQGKL